MTIETETIDKLFLELSQFTQATTGKELALRNELSDCIDDFNYLKTVVQGKDGLHMWFEMRVMKLTAVLKGQP